LFPYPTLFRSERGRLPRRRRHPTPRLAHGIARSLCFGSGRLCRRPHPAPLPLPSSPVAHHRLPCEPQRLRPRTYAAPAARLSHVGVSLRRQHLLPSRCGACRGRVLDPLWSSWQTAAPARGNGSLPPPRTRRRRDPLHPRCGGGSLGARRAARAEVVPASSMAARTVRCHLSASQFRIPPRAGTPALALPAPPSPLSLHATGAGRSRATPRGVSAPGGARLPGRPRPEPPPSASPPPRHDDAGARARSMSDTPRVSVVVPVFNAGRRLEQALDSV